MDSTLSFLPGDKAAELLLLGLYFCHLPLLCHALSHNVPTATGTAPEPPMSPTLVVVSFQLWPISLASQRCQLPSPWPAQHSRRLSATTTAIWASCPQLPAALQLGERVGLFVAVISPSPGSSLTTSRLRLHATQWDDLSIHLILSIVPTPRLHFRPAVSMLDF